MHSLPLRRRGVASVALVTAFALFGGRELRGTNIAVSGFNEDVVTEVGASPFAHRFDGWQASLVEQGAKDASGRIANVGLPSSRTFISATGSGVVYDLQPYNAVNALRMGDGDPQAGTMTVISGQYATLHILVASGTGGGVAGKQSGDVVLNFADGSVTLLGALRAYDWGTGPANDVAIGGMARNLLGQASGGSVNIQYASDYVGVNQPVAYKLYENPIDLNALGFSHRTLSSIGFTNAADIDGATDVMAIDGVQVVPEPASILLLAIGVGGIWFIRCQRAANAGDSN